MSPDIVAIKAQRIITPLQDLRDSVVLVAGSKIQAVARAENIGVPESARVVDAGGLIVAPGFIDLHHLGALGAYAAEGPEAVRTIAQYLVRTGATGWLPTIGTAEGIKGVVEAMGQGTGGSEVLGLHMEGPFLAPKRIPGHEVVDQHLRLPSVDGFREFAEAAAGQLKIMGIAPELDGALDVISEMRRLGVVSAAAHTKATYERFMRAVEVGLRHVTHTFNVMSGLHHRAPGVVDAVLTCDQVTAELIADGFHVSPVAMDVLVRCKGPSQIAVITDNVPLAGLPDGTYEMFGRKAVKEDGVSRMVGTTPDQDHTMAGSEWPMNANLQNLVHRVGVPFAQAIRMATLTPATIVDVDRHKGSIEPGKDADLVAIDEQFNVHWTMVKGEMRFEADAASFERGASIRMTDQALA